MSTRLLNEKEVAEMLGMSVAWMRHKRFYGGGVPYLKMAGGKGAIRYDEKDVEEFKRNCVRISTSQG
ncbi:MAG: helix-turn-helix domain-containing protein [Geobacter sp.]|nr:MAG: helix-turn-helix domain-containing protein [Geobacter sp.]